MSSSNPNSEFLRAHLIRFVGLVLSMLCFSLSASGQIVTTTTSITDGRTPSGIEAGTPAGSYPLTGFDNVNIYNGNLNFHLPLLEISGRGSANMTITLALNLKSWRTRHIHKDMPDGSTIDSYVPTQTGWLPYAGYGAGRLDGRNYGLQTSSNISCRWYSKTVSRLTFSAADGTEIELRDQLTNGQPLSSSCNQGAYRGTVFVTADGSAATFISDTAVYDNPAINSFGPHGFSVSGVLMLRDGTRYRIDNGNVTWIRDRNGNKLTFVYSGSSMTITDSLNRQVTVNYDVSDVAPYGLCDQITYKGFGGAQRILRVSHTNLANALRPNSGYSIRTLGGPSGLFPETNGSSSTNHDPTVTSAVWLPDGRSYKFFYNSYGELARVEVPTGGAYEYDMTSGSGVICPNFCWPEDDRQIYRRVIERRVYPNGGAGGSFERKEVYTNTEAYGGATATVTVEQFSPTLTVLARSRHFFATSALNSLFSGGGVAYAYAPWYEGNETQTEALSTTGDISTATVLRRTVTTRLNRTSVAWWASHASTYGLDINKEPPNDPRPIETVATIEPATSNLVSKQTFGYDDSVPFNNQNNVKEYGFNTGVPGGLIRETRTTFLTSSAYTDTNVHIRNLPLQVSVYDGNTIERTRSIVEYDNYNADSYHAGLVPRSNISGLDSAFTTSYTTRGNPTSLTRYLLVNQVVTGSTTSYSQYDVAGNIVKLIDSRSTPSNIIATSIEYDDRYGIPDNEAQSNTNPAELTAFASFALATKVINSLGHTTFTQFDYYLNMPVNVEDMNGIVASGHFNDLLDRPTQIRRAVGTTIENQTTFAYDDINRIVTTSRDQDGNNDNVIVSKVLYDKLGRTTETRQYEGGGNYIATQTQYDALGRAYKTSNPFRPWQSETPVWTTQVFDALGRVTSLTTPDNAVVNTSYSSNRVTVTDQAGKARQSVSDALGRVIEVYEDPSGVNYQTTYTYDVVDNLIKITQGSQQRFFMYDSLNRLIRVRTPEQATNNNLDLTDPLTQNSQWSSGFAYDSNDNLIQKTDARGVVSTYGYDALNRSTTINYSDTTTINPDVTRYYDGATNGKGRFWTSYSGGDYSNGANVDHTAVDSYDALGRPLVQRQLFKLNNVWSAPYQTSRSYTLAGGVKSQTYPSVHSVNYNYDVAGRLADKDASQLAFTGNLGDGVLRTYSRGISYVSAGQLSQERFGTTTTVYHNRHYNVRRQLCDVRASNSSDEWGGELGALVNYYSTSWAHCGSGTDNNGNVLMSQTIINSVYFEDRYTYDALNRLTAVSEYQNGSSLTGTQQYSYDRWGNRNITPSSPALGFNTNFEKEDATNRLYAPGDLVLADASRRIRYDAAGNQIKDTYTGYGSANFDADNHITAIQDKLGVWSNYTYNAAGQRTRRKINNQETWQIYGFGGELLAEYPAGGTPLTPQKEYGYRNGQLLVTTGAMDTVWSDDAVPAGATIAGDSEGWNWVSSNPGSFSGSTAHQSNIVAGLHQHYFYGSTATLSVDTGDKLVAYVYLDPSNMPSQIMLQWNDGSWEHRAYWGANNLPWGVDGTNSRRYMGSLPAGGGWVRLEVPASLVGLEGHTLNGMAFSMWGGRATWDQVGKTSSTGVGSSLQWLVADHLGTPRMVIDQTGALANIKRHDYLPFGEELFAQVGSRSTGLGYATADGLRQKFTGKERDVETGLDYFLARYYSSTQGRFTSPDSVGGSRLDPQSLNLYSYVQNNPIRDVDPTGHYSINPQPDPFNPFDPQLCMLCQGDGQKKPTTTATRPDVPEGYEIKEDGSLVRKGGGAVVEETVEVKIAKQRLFKRVWRAVRGAVLRGPIGGAAHIILGEMIDPEPVGGGDADLGEKELGFAYDVQDTFLNRQFSPTRLKEDTIFYRVYSDPARMKGRFLTDHNFQSSELAIKMLALSPVTGNKATHIVGVIVPKGTVIARGQVAPQSPSDKYPGHGLQVVIPNPDDPNIKWVPLRPLNK